MLAGSDRCLPLGSFIDVDIDVDVVLAQERKQGVCMVKL